MSRPPGVPAVPAVPARVAAICLDSYKRWISPLLPRSCRYSPTCSEYARLAVLRHGLLGGLVRAGWRLARCQPLGGGGIDLP
ncbi:MAG: membrane protein insertion efficiency factor YidD [Acidobacteriota bacterium]